MVKPIIKWAGGKASLLAQLKPLIPKKINRYYEPFLGGGAVGFELEHTPARLTDINPYLVRTYKAVKLSVDPLITHLSAYQDEYNSMDMADKQMYYYTQRRYYNTNRDVLTDVELAALFIFLNKTCSRGLYRCNLKGGFNVPFGRYEHFRPNFDNINAMHEYMCRIGVKLCVSNYDNFGDNVPCKGDFVYFDPPYYPIQNGSKTKSFTNYTKNGFTQVDHLKLRNLVEVLTQKKVSVMLSNADCPEVRTLYKRYKLTEITAKRNIHSKMSGSAKAKELIITNY